MKFWQCLAMTNMEELPVIVKKAEELGFEGVSFSDHLVTFDTLNDKYCGKENADIVWHASTHWPDPLIQIAALSQITKSIKFLTSIYVLSMRDPFTAAKSISTTALLSNDRLMMGVGSGWQKSEFNIVGKNFHDRGKRTDEMIEIIKKLMSGKNISHSGSFYHFDSLSMSPSVPGGVPILIGGTSEAALRRAARNDGWVGYQHEISELENIASYLKEARKVQFNTKKPFTMLASIKNITVDSINRAEESGITAIYKDAWLDENGRASKLSLDQKLAEMENFSEKFIL